MHENDISRKILDCAFTVHNELGPGLLESVYESALEWELRAAGLRVKRQQPFPVVYKGQKPPDGFRADLVVEDKVIIEIKAQDGVPLVAYKVLRSYLRFADIRLGLLINFHEEHLKDGIKRVVNNL